MYLYFFDGILVHPLFQWHQAQRVNSCFTEPVCAFLPWVLVFCQLNLVLACVHHRCQQLGCMCAYVCRQHVHMLVAA